MNSNLEIKQKAAPTSLLEPLASLVDGSKSRTWLPLVDTVWNSALTFDKSRMIMIHKILDAANSTEGGIQNVTIDMVR